MLLAPRVQNPWSGGAGFERSGPLQLRPTFFCLLCSAPGNFLDSERVLVVVGRFRDQFQAVANFGIEIFGHETARPPSLVTKLSKTCLNTLLEVREQ